MINKIVDNDYAFRTVSEEAILLIFGLYYKTSLSLMPKIRRKYPNKAKGIAI